MGIKSFIKGALQYFVLVLSMWLAVLLITDAPCFRQGIIDSVELCMNVIIPSLFAFMSLSGIIVSSGLYALLSKPFWLLSKLIGIPPELFGIFLISNCAGYPVGTKLLCDMTDGGWIDKNAAQTLQCFCFGAGPAFLCSAVGSTLFGSINAGVIIFLSCFISSLVLALVMCHITRIKTNNNHIQVRVSAQILTDSILSAGKALVILCTFILFFSIVITALDHYGIISALSHLFGKNSREVLVRSVLDISNLARFKDAAFSYLPIVSALCSFGGLCVVIQLKALIGDRYSLKLFLLTRPVVCALSALNSLWLSDMLLPDAMQACTTSPHVFVKVNNFVPSVCLILMIFLLKIKKRVAFSNLV